MKEALVSVIVPVYNANSYLSNCIDSIVNQTYHNIEIICVNDGSTDNSLELLEEYENKDNRIIIINKTNEGVSSARNNALGLIRGEYTLFVDADDWINPDTIEVSMNAIDSTGSDVVIWSYVSERRKGSSEKHIFENDILFSSEEVMDKIQRRLVGLIGSELSHPEQADSLSTVWAKLYKSEIILSSKFINLDQIGSYEDGLFNLDVFGRVNKAAYIDRPMYHYRRENYSSQTSLYRPNLNKQWQQLFGMMDDYITSHELGEKYKEALYNRIALSILGLGLNITAYKGSFLMKRALLKEIIQTETYKEAINRLEMEFLPLKWKLFYLCAKKRWAFSLMLLLTIINYIING